MPDELAILPKPRVLEYREGSFVPGSRVCIAFEGQGAHGVAAYLSRSLEDLGVRTEGGPGDAPRILLAIEPGSLGSEGYELLVGSSEIRLCAAEPRGLFSGCQTLRQMLAEAPEPLPAVRIFDEPRFSWRGMHLDVSRHFFPIDFVKRYVDILAYHKLNTFHWHLTDDQGW
ncbi:MAG: family 20 glycosylhydrolase, partial [Planctomycetota bacterium]